MDPQNDIPGVPPPPAEVKVRTMHSDIESMTKSGGGLPQFQNVTVQGLAIEREVPTAAAPEVAAEMARAQAGTGPAATAELPASAEGSSEGSHKLAGIILVVIVSLAAVLAVSYFAYKELWSSGAGSSVPAAPAPTLPSAPTAGQSSAG